MSLEEVLAYASVGLGGGTAYTALLAILGASHEMVPTISLLLNVIVTSIGTLVFLGKRHGRQALILPFVTTSVPAAYIGRRLSIPPDIFYGLLLLSLILAAVRIFVWDETALNIELSRAQK